MLRRAVLGIAVGLLSLAIDPAPGTAVAQARSSVTETDTSPIVLTVQVDVQPSGAQERRPVRPGETLRSGDRIAIRVEVNQSAYVRVLQVFPSGKSAALFPPASARQEEAFLEAGVQRAIPSNGGMLELDDELGQENIVVTASTKPLDEAGARAALPSVALSAPAEVAPASAAVRLAAGSPPPPPPPPPPPYPLEPGERDPIIKVPGKPYLLRVRSAKSGIALLRFDFKHAAAASAKRPVSAAARR